MFIDGLLNPNSILNCTVFVYGKGKGYFVKYSPLHKGRTKSYIWPYILSLFLIQTVHHFKNPILERGSTVLLLLLYHAHETTLKSEMGLTGELWLKTNLLNLQNLENSIFLAKENKKILKKWSNVRLKFFVVDVFQIC